MRLRTADSNARRARDWEAWADARIAKAIERDWTRRRDDVAEMIEEARQYMLEVIGIAVSEERERHRGELAKLEARIKALEQQRGATADVVNLSSPVVRKRKDNAA